MEKQNLYVKLNEIMTTKVLLDSPVDINELKRTINRLDRVNEPIGQGG